MARGLSAQRYMGGAVMRTGVIGAVTIATALFTGIARDGHRIEVSECSGAKAKALAARFDCV